ncbi:hypothetical protein HDV01_007245 [Terramyces sp. JEL0728]|nr:hypothetical protein HDV01_007245 [Terramyces sp. JEL0728]
MHHINKLFTVLILVLDYQQNSEEGTDTKTWNTLFLVCDSLQKIKNQTKKQPNPIAVKTTIDISYAKSPKNSILSLPNEILLAIADHVQLQETVAELSMTNKRMYHLLRHKLYKHPILTSPASINNFIYQLERNSSLADVTGISFGPSTVGSLSKPDLKTDKTENIPFVHSGLFRYFIYKELDENNEIVDLLLYRLMSLLPNIQLYELAINKENAPALDYHSHFIHQRKDVRRIPSSSFTLTALHQAFKKWKTEFKEWNGLKDDINECLETSQLLLDWFQGDFHPIWHQLGSDVVRSVKTVVLNQCRSLLNQVNTILLLQVRFITGNSQRLLDCYCLIYYRMLSIAQQLDIEALVNILKAEETPRCSSVELATANKQVAKSIYEALMVIFHLQLPQSEIPVQLLRDIMVSFPPSAINGESIEFITHLLKVQLEDDENRDCLQLWLTWLNEIVKWYESSKEMDPVKDLLRKSMGKIDLLRGIQRRYAHLSAIHAIVHLSHILNYQYSLENMKQWIQLNFLSDLQQEYKRISGLLNPKQDSKYSDLLDSLACCGFYEAIEKLEPEFTVWKKQGIDKRNSLQFQLKRGGALKRVYEVMTGDETMILQLDLNWTFKMMALLIAGYKFPLILSLLNPSNVIDQVLFSILANEHDSTIELGARLDSWLAVHLGDLYLLENKIKSNESQLITYGELILEDWKMAFEYLPKAYVKGLVVRITDASVFDYCQEHSLMDEKSEIHRIFAKIPGEDPIEHYVQSNDLHLIKYFTPTKEYPQEYLLKSPYLNTHHHYEKFKKLYQEQQYNEASRILIDLIKSGNVQERHLNDCLGLVESGLLVFTEEDVYEMMRVCEGGLLGLALVRILSSCVINGQ